MSNDFAVRIANNIAAVSEAAGEAARAAGRNPGEVRILAVSKTQPAGAVAAAYSAGIRIFGENYAQELRDKAPETEEILGVSPEWHFIGHLQTNKCKYVAPYCSTIHSLDSVGLAQELSKFANKFSKNFSVLLQVNTSGEASKYGCAPEDLESLVASIMPIDGIRIIGLTTIAGLSGTSENTIREFALLRHLRETLADETGRSESELELSMGMSGDFREAIAEGATIIRIGSLIFGERPPKPTKTSS
ncbi:MAG: YggS family pyridoxal phosphate-dependent enzyme [Bacteroidetes bacterium]|nr:YggS family pyridoxal phosphate-dependent enzyme [Bacteroidota bacterium]